MGASVELHIWGACHVYHIQYCQPHALTRTAQGHLATNKSDNCAHRKWTCSNGRTVPGDDSDLASVTDWNCPICISGYVHGLDGNILEVADITKSQGPIAFTKKRVYPISGQFMHITNLGKRNCQLPGWSIFYHLQHPQPVEQCRVPKDQVALAQSCQRCAHIFWTEITTGSSHTTPQNHGWIEDGSNRGSNCVHSHDSEIPTRGFPSQYHPPMDIKVAKFHYLPVIESCQHGCYPKISKNAQGPWWCKRIHYANNMQCIPNRQDVTIVLSP